ncbi:hypothetical protein FRB98_002259 [Tulasnella sp. 332]|nr:hypothetical protein FRB98_002259 [Tulasnella sp. 332]
MSFHERAKATAPYIVGGGKIALKTASTVASFVGPPGAQTAIDIALQGVKANKDDTLLLKDRILTLLGVIATSVEGSEKIVSDLQTSVDRLIGDLVVILGQFQDMRESSFVRKVLLSQEDSDKIKGLSGKLDWAMRLLLYALTLFLVSMEGHINESLRLQDLTESNRRVQASIQNTKDEIKVLLRETSVMGQGMKALMQTAKRLLYGRDAEVHEIAGRLISTKSPRYALIMAGGIGKTALAMAIWEHMDIVDKYGDRRFCFRCEQATSAALFVDLLAFSLGMEDTSSDRMKDVVITSMVTVCRRMLDNSRFLARALYWSGMLLEKLDRRNEARVAFEGALSLFAKSSRRGEAADCLVAVGDLHGLDSQAREARAAYMKASKIYEELGRKGCIARCLQGLGFMQLDERRHDDAQSAFEKVSEAWEEMDERLGTENGSIGHWDCRSQAASI